MKNKRIYAWVRTKKDKIGHLFEFPLVELLKGEEIQLVIGNYKVKLFISDKGLSHEDITGYSCIGTIEEPNEWLKELCERKKQAE